MPNESFHNINQLISSFELFINTYENQCKFTTNEEIKSCFKLASFIEEAVVNFQTKGTISKWIEVLNKYLLEKNSSYKCYSDEFFSTACDHLLYKFFEFSSTDVNIIDIAVRIYTSLLPKSRFQKFLSNLLMKSASYKVILEFVIENEAQDSRKLQYKLLLNDWSLDLKSGKSNVSIFAEEMLQLSKVEKSLHMLVGILSLENVSKDENLVKQIVLEIILKKMLDRSVLSKSFWLTMFNINTDDLLKVCEVYDDFLESLCNFMIYLGCMMEKNDGVWMSNQSISICPEITYNDLLSLVKLLSNDNFINKNYTIDRIKQAEINTGSDLWTQILRDL